MIFLKKHMFTIIGAIVGAAAGFAYFFYVGCKSGTCPITSHPFNSTVYGAVLGGLFVSSFGRAK